MQYGRVDFKLIRVQNYFSARVLDLKVNFKEALVAPIAYKLEIMNGKIVVERLDTVEPLGICSTKERKANSNSRIREYITI